MPNNKYNIDDVFIVYDYQVAHQQLREWLSANFHSAVNLYQGFTDRLNYDLSRRIQAGQESEPRKLQPRDTALLVKIDEQVMLGHRATQRDGYGRYRANWIRANEDGTETYLPSFYPMEIKHIKTLTIPQEEDSEEAAE